MLNNDGFPLEAEHDEALQVVTASRVLSVEEYADLGERERAEGEAQAAVESLMAERGLDYNDTPQRIWLRMESLSGDPPRGHHFEFRARVRAVTPRP